MATDPPDDASDATPVDVRNSRIKDSQLDEKTVKFRFVPSRTNDTPISPRVFHSHWIKAVQDEFGDQIQILDNHNRPVPKIDLLRWSEIQHQQNFAVHKHTPKHQFNHNPIEQRNDQSRFHSPSEGKACFIIHRIRTNIPLKDIKAIPRISQILKENACYANQHKWAEDIWDTTQLGFMTNLDPQFYSVDQATLKLSQILQNSAPKAKIPQFRLVYCAPKIRTQDYFAATKAYAVETEKSNAKAMTDILMQVFRESLHFVPFQMRNKSPKAFTHAIRLQSDSIANHHTIILQNIGVDAMYYLSDHILNLEGSIDLTPAKSVEWNGNYRLLVTKQHFRLIRKSLMRQLPEWFTIHVPTDAHPREDVYPGSPCVAAIAEDGYSSGEDSYMNMSINTALSYDCSLSDMDSYSRAKSSDYSNSGSSYRHHHDAGIPSKVQMEQNSSWAARLGMPIASINAINNSPDVAPPRISSPPLSEATSELRSSRAEVEEMRNQLKEVTEAFAQEKDDMLKSFAQEKKDLIQTMKIELANSFREQMQLFSHRPPAPVEPPQLPLAPSVQNQLQAFIDIQEDRYRTLQTMVATLMEEKANRSTAPKRQSDQIQMSHQESPLQSKRDKRHQINTSATMQATFSDIVDAQASPSNIPGHKEMDLADDSLSFEGELADLSMIEDSPINHHQHE